MLQIFINNLEKNNLANVILYNYYLNCDIFQLIIHLEKKKKHVVIICIFYRIHNFDSKSCSTIEWSFNNCD